MRHLIDFGDLTRAEWESLYQRCSDIMDHPADFMDACRGRVMASLFYEPSTRTNFSFQTARNIGAAAVAAGIRLSLHAPYFINLANPDPESLQKTIGYITAACQAADWMGAGRVVIHSGALMKRTGRLYA